ncbi:hypothetical protein ADK38_23780, partial [Streptomyces varsoviensis]
MTGRWPRSWPARGCGPLRTRRRSAPYTAREVAAGEARVAARLADRLLRGALSFDDAVQPAARLEEAFGRPPRGSDREQAEERQMREACLLYT